MFFIVVVFLCVFYCYFCCCYCLYVAAAFIIPMVTIILQVALSGIMNVVCLVDTCTAWLRAHISCFLTLFNGTFVPEDGTRILGP